MNSTKVPKRRRRGMRVERIFERWLVAEIRKKKYWLIGVALVWFALMIVFLISRP